MDGANIRPSTAPMLPLADAGYQLIPLHRWNKTSACSRTGKTRERGKSPRDRNWTTKPYQNEKVLAQVDETGINAGVRLRANQLVVDIDPRNIEGGLRTAKFVLRKKLGVEPSNFPVVETGSGGWHIYMTKPINVVMSDALPDLPGIEFKSIGRQVVAPGSIHPNGTAYSWLDGAMEPGDMWLGVPVAPDSLLDIARKRARTTRLTGEGLGEHPLAEIATILANMDPTDFQDHDKWLNLMMACHHASAGEAREEFIAWCTRDPLYAEDGAEIAYRWDSLVKTGVGLGTLYMFMKGAGCGHLIDRRARTSAFDDFDDGEVLA